MSDLTKKEAVVREEIQAFTEKHGCAPTLQELGGRLEQLERWARMSVGDMAKEIRAEARRTYLEESEGWTTFMSRETFEPTKAEHATGAFEVSINRDDPVNERQIRRIARYEERSARDVALDMLELCR